MDTAKTIKELEKRRDAIGMERDKLRDMMGDMEDLHSTCADAYHSIQDAIDALSQFA